mgnify:CR=1 FL=1
MTTLYGTNTANGTLTNACNFVATTGAAETSKTTTTSGANSWAEVLSQGGAFTDVSAIGSPSGKGWVYSPGSGTFATGNWSASITLSSASRGVSAEVRFYKYSGGTYTAIGNITATITTTAKTTYSFAATSMSATTLGSSDLLYVDLWWFDNNSNASGDNPVVYVANSSTQGVANDMQITTSTFTASGTHLRIMDGYGGVFS